MEPKTLMLGIENEFEGDSTLWFDLNDPGRLVNYLKDNIEHNANRIFLIKEFTEIEIAELDS